MLEALVALADSNKEQTAEVGYQDHVWHSNGWLIGCFVLCVKDKENENHSLKESIEGGSGHNEY